MSDQATIEITEDGISLECDTNWDGKSAIRHSKVELVGQLMCTVAAELMKAPVDELLELNRAGATVDWVIKPSDVV